MAVSTFAVPILPGKTEAWKEAMASINGPRRKEYEEARRRIGVKREVVGLQSTPQGDLVAVYMEAEDLPKAFAAMLASEAPFDRWFVEEVLKGIHGWDPSRGPLPFSPPDCDFSA